MDNSSTEGDTVKYHTNQSYGVEIEQLSSFAVLTAQAAQRS